MESVLAFVGVVCTLLLPGGRGVERIKKKSESKGRDESDEMQVYIKRGEWEEKAKVSEEGRLEQEKSCREKKKSKAQNENMQQLENQQERGERRGRGRGEVGGKLMEPQKGGEEWERWEVQ